MVILVQLVQGSARDGYIANLQMPNPGIKPHVILISVLHLASRILLLPQFDTDSSPRGLIVLWVDRTQVLKPVLLPHSAALFLNRAIPPSHTQDANSKRCAETHSG